MINIKILKQNSKIKSIDVSGHANSGAYGNDLVCAAITGIVSGALNALNNYAKDIDLQVLDNRIFIEVNNLENQILQIMLQMLFTQLQTIAVQYPKNIKLMEV